jgi:hypothetical protein
VTDTFAVRCSEGRAFDSDERGTARQLGHPAASRSSAFIWRTASRNPTNTARDTIA